MAAESQTPSQVAIAPPAGSSSYPSRVRIFFVLLTAFLLMIAIGGTSLGYFVHSWEDNLRAETERSLTQKARMFAADVNSDRTRNIATLASQEGQLAGARATVVDMNGKVIADSEVRVVDLEGEGRMPEFAAALHGDTGVNTRSRSAFGTPILYVAVPVFGGAVRLAYPLADLSIASAHASRMLELGCAIAVIAALIISAVASVAISPSMKS